MLFLVFQSGGHRYALDADRIVEVLPLVSVHEMARVPGEVAGLLIYRGASVPVIDLSQLLDGRPAVQRLSTRVVIAEYPLEDGERRLVGFIAERATETIRREITDFVHSRMVNAAAPYLGAVTTDARGLVQRVDITRILPASPEAPSQSSAEHAWHSPNSRTC